MVSVRTVVEESKRGQTCDWGRFTRTFWATVAVGVKASWLGVGLSGGPLGRMSGGLGGVRGYPVPVIILVDHLTPKYT